MFHDKKIVAVIPARAGSKGIPNKNIVDVNGNPLIVYTINAALESRYIDRIYVSTDSIEIADVCRAHGVEVERLRPQHLATDEAKTIDVLKYTLHSLQSQNEIYDYVVLLQPTQPLRSCVHIDEAISLIAAHEDASIISVSEVEDHPLFMRKINESGKLESLLQTSSTVRRQDLPIYYKVNGAIYINKVSDIVTQDISLNDNKIPYVMDKKYDLDVDTLADLEKLRWLLK
ncbi:acylneuraminate cytidylyltransferase family protein [Paenibacillus sp. AD87]|uniref:acylneuraminate cytidylyltransferase family protein n=1 Tax=Paenibacillus sp. AD87 TaxID=1528787 RepID=UPI0007E396C6|nr:acylneuraminate cytidylyltransferase family protein [Paenibacillus sp. AD87]OAX46342.1 N-acylneuraminate cytidylyltransferase [Paenibacillus sp. AD87]